MLSLFLDRKPAPTEALSGDPFDDKYYESVPGIHLGRSLAGVNVNEYTAMNYSGCWAATMLLITATSMMPLKLLRKLPSGGSEPALDDWRYSLVHDTPNPDMTSMMFRASRTNHQVNWGNGFAEIEFNRGGRPIALHPIHASRIPSNNIKRGSNGRLKYQVFNDNGGTTEIPAERMLHIPSPMSDDGIIGKGVITHARLSIGLGIATETQGAAYFGNSAAPKLVVTQTSPAFKKAEDLEEFRRQWNEVHGGPSNSGKPAFLPVGAGVVPIEFSAEDSQFLQTRQFSIDDLARWYGIPPHTIGSLLRATHSNIEQQALELTKYSLMRWTIPLEQELNRKLLTPEERGTLYFHHVFEGLERADITTRTTALKEQFFNGELTLNEWRSLENRSSIGPLGDLHFVQQAMVPLEIAAKGPQPSVAPAEEEPEDDGLSRLAEEFATLKQEWATATTASITLSEVAKRVEELANLEAMAKALATKTESTQAVQKQLASALLRDVMGRMLSVEIHNVRQIAEKPSRFDQRLREFYSKHQATMERSLAPVLLSDSAATAKAMAESHVTESLRQLDALCDCTAEELSGKVEQCVSKWHEERMI